MKGERPYNDFVLGIKELGGGSCEFGVGSKELGVEARPPSIRRLRLRSPTLYSFGDGARTTEGGDLVIEEL